MVQVHVISECFELNPRSHALELTLGQILKPSPSIAERSLWAVFLSAQISMRLIYYSPKKKPMKNIGGKPSYLGRKRIRRFRRLELEASNGVVAR